MGMQLLQFDQLVQSNRPYQDESGFFSHVRRQAANALAQKIMENASLYERIDPTEEELRQNPCAPIRHRWKIGVQTEISEIEARAREADTARRQGLNEAADFLFTQLTHAYGVEGPCSHVLRYQLERNIERLRELAKG